MKKHLPVLAIIVLSLAACDMGADSAYPVQYVEKVDSTPDLTQTDPALGLVEGGRMSCGSVSVTNSFAWLADNGFEDVMLKDESGNVSYTKTAQALDRVLGIVHSKGVLPPAFLRGISRYLSQRGYTDNDYQLEFQGWCHSSHFQGERIPDIDTIKKSIVGDSAVWLLVGFYRFHEESDEYRKG